MRGRSESRAGYRHSRQRGATLLSVACAMTVLAMVLTLTATTLIGAQEITRGSRQSVLATELLNSTMEELRTSPQSLRTERKVTLQPPELRLLRDGKLVVHIQPQKDTDLALVEAQLTWRAGAPVSKGRTVTRSLVALLSTEEGS